MPLQPAKSEEIGHRTVTDAAVASFGCLTGDYARMHLDLAFGSQVGMSGPIAHGLLSAAWALGALTAYEPERVARGDAAAVPAAFQIRFGRMVHIGDRFSLRWWEQEFPDDPAFEGPYAFGGPHVDTAFETLNQRGETTCTGALRIASGAAPPPPEPLAIEPWSRHDVTALLHADDMPARGPRGVSEGRTLVDADLVAWAGFTAEQNPLYLNAEFARAGRFGAPIAPPMLIFCLAFGDYLRDLLSIRMPSAGFAGHLGDGWRFYAPVHVGDTIRVRHKPVACVRSKSRPEMGIVRFALQVENQRGEIVQDGRVAMMMPAATA